MVNISISSSYSNALLIEKIFKKLNGRLFNGIIRSFLTFLY